MKTLDIAKKQGLEMVRDWKVLFFMLAFPALFMSLFGFAFSVDYAGTSEYDIAVINLDQGIENYPGNNTTQYFGQQYVSILEDLRYTDEEGENTTRMFNVRTDLGREDAMESLKGRELVAVVIIPANFSMAMAAEIQSYVNSHFSEFTGLPPGSTSYPTDLTRVDENVTASITVKGDPGMQSYYAASGIISGVFQGFKDRAKEIALNRTEEYLASESVPIELNREELKAYMEQESISDVEEVTAYDYMVPGMMIFGILMGGIGVVSTLAEENERGTLDRLKITRMRSSHLLLGTLTAYSLVAILQVMVLFGVAILMGYNYHPGASLALAALIAIFAGMATTALGLIMAAFVKNSDQAGHIGPLVTVPISFLIGAFFPMPNPTLIADFYSKGRDFGLWDILPWRQGFLALSKVLTYGEGLGAISTELVLMIIQSALLLALGIYLYDRNQLKSE